MSELPAATQQNPACGACRGETRDEGDQFVCDDCQLAYDTILLEPSFIDPTAKVCGAPCDNSWHGDNKIRAGIGYRCGTCRLPEGHSPLHWTGCEQVPLAAESSR